MPNIRSQLFNAGQTAELMIYDQIGQTFWGDGITAKHVADELKKIGNAKTINVRINSIGGSVSDGIAIYNLLKRNSARIEVDIDSAALSIASVIAMAGDQIHMAKNAMFMIHDPWGMAHGNAVDMRKTADIMDQHKENLVTTYADRTLLDADKISALMSDETWYTAREAFEAGFIDDITEETQIVARFDPKIFNRVPDEFKQRVLQALSDTPVVTPRLDVADAMINRIQQRLRESAARAATSA
jgi:ATP-dependent Clp protease protease subunit